MNTTTKDLWWCVMVMMVLSFMVIVTGCCDSKSELNPKFHYADNVEIKSGFFKGCFGMVKSYEFSAGKVVYQIDPALCPADHSSRVGILKWVQESDLVEGTIYQFKLVERANEKTNKPKTKEK